MNQNAEIHSGVLNALRWTGRTLVNDSDLRFEHRRQLISELETMHGKLAELWQADFEYISPWSEKISPMTTNTA